MMSEDKTKRRVRRANHIAKDLCTPKYRQRVVDRKPKYEPTIEEFEMEDGVEE